MVEKDNCIDFIEDNSMIQNVFMNYIKILKSKQNGITRKGVYGRWMENLFEAMCYLNALNKWKRLHCYW